MAYVVFKKQPYKIEYFIRRSISLQLNELKFVLPSDKVIIEIYSCKLPPKDRVAMPEKIIIEMNGKDFINNAKIMNDKYCVIECQD